MKRRTRQAAKEADADVRAERVELHADHIGPERAVVLAGVLFATGAKPIRVVRDPAEAIPWVWLFFNKSAINPVRFGIRETYAALAEGRPYDDDRRVLLPCTTRVLAAQRLCGELGMLAPEGETEAASWRLASVAVREMIGQRVEVLVDAGLVPWTAEML